MAHKIQLHIPEPCHENWNKMDITEQGRYCQSCCKQVVDFTMMSDEQIIDYLSNTKGKTCGRFDHDQLNHSLQKNKLSYWKWFIATFTLLFFSFSKTYAQKKEQCNNKNKVIKDNENTKQLMGKVPQNIISVDTSKLKIVGQLVAPEKNKLRNKRKKKQHISIIGV